MKKFKLIIFIIGLLVFLFSAHLVESKSLYIEFFATKDGKITLYRDNIRSITVKEDNFVKELEERGNYLAKIFSFKNELLDEIYFFPRSIIFYDREDPKTGRMTGGMIISREGYFVKKFPYYPNGKYIEIFDDKNEKQLTIDISRFALCNENGICDEKEDEKNCPQDCLQKPTTTQFQTPLVPPKKSQKKKYTVLGFLIILGLIVFVALKIIKRKET